MAHQKQHLASDLPLLVMAAGAWGTAARWRLAVCGACSRTWVRSASSSPRTRHRTTARNRCAASVLGMWGVRIAQY